MRMVHIPSALVLVFSAAVVVGGVVIVRQAGRLSGYERLHAQDARMIEQLSASLRQRQAPPPEPAAHSQSAPAPAPVRPGALYTSASPAREATIQQLNRELGDAQAAIALLQTQVQSSCQEKQNALTAASEDFRKREQDWRDRLDSFQQQLDSARAGAQAARERAAGLEADNAKLKNESGAGSARAAELRKAMAGLQDLDRRRDVYLNSIIRRYREITGQFRAMTGVLDSSHGSDSESYNGVALSRSQNAISLAEDDLRRLNEMNSQAHQLENKLAKD
jgi:DNA repair exonuclease SbcCD ATPase subunit